MKTDWLKWIAQNPPPDEGLMPGQSGAWRGLPVQVQAYQDTPEGRLLYCTVAYRDGQRTHWLDATEVRP